MVHMGTVRALETGLTSEAEISMPHMVHQEDVDGDFYLPSLTPKRALVHGMNVLAVLNASRMAKGNKDLREAMGLSEGFRVIDRVVYVGEEVGKVANILSHIIRKKYQTSNSVQINRAPSGNTRLDSGSLLVVYDENATPNNQRLREGSHMEYRIIPDMLAGETNLPPYMRSGDPHHPEWVRLSNSGLYMVFKDNIINH